MWSRNIVKTTLILSFMSLVVGSLLAVTLNPVTGYIVSIQSTYSLIYYILLVGTIITAVAALLLAAFLKYHKGALTAAIAIIVGYGLLYSIPAFAGWELYGRGYNDVLAHWGYTQTIIQTGHISQLDWYPALHFLQTNLSLLGLNQSWVNSLLSSIFNSLFLAGMFLYGREIRSDWTVGAIFFAVSSVPVFMLFHRSMHPFMLSFFLIPLLLTVFERYLTDSDPRYRIVVIIMTLALVIYHPVTIVFLLGLYATRILLAQRRTLSLDLLTFRSGFTLFLATGLVFIYWYFFMFGRLARLITGVIGIVFGLSASAVSETASSGFSSSLTSLHLLIRLIELYGPPLFILGVAGIITLISLVKWQSLGDSPGRLLQRTSIEYVIAGGFSVFFLIVVPIIERPLRAVHFALLPALILTGYAIHYLYNCEQREKVATCMTILLLTTLFIGGGNVYRDNRHLTATEIAGNDMLHTFSDDDSIIISLDTGHKLVRYLYGYDVNAVEVTPQSLYVYRDPKMSLLKNGTAVDTYPNANYITVKSYDTQRKQSYYREQYSQKNIIKPSEVEKLNADTTSSKIYTNGNFRTWIIHK